MNIVESALIISAAGSFGGLVNALLVDRGFRLPKKRSVKIDDEEYSVITIGWIGNFFMGAFSSLASWGLYGPVSTYSINSQVPVEISISALIGAALVGAAGSRGLTNTIDKEIFKISTAKISSYVNVPENIPHQLMMLSTDRVLDIADQLEP